MILGQSAATAAAHAIDEGRAVQEIDHARGCANGCWLTVSGFDGDGLTAPHGVKEHTWLQRKRGTRREAAIEQEAGCGCTSGASKGGAARGAAPKPAAKTRCAPVGAARGEAGGGADGLHVPARAGRGGRGG